MTHEEVTLIGGLISALPNLAVALSFLVLFVRGDIVARRSVDHICEEFKKDILSELRERERSSEAASTVDNTDTGR